MLYFNSLCLVPRTLSLCVQPGGATSGPAACVTPNPQLKTPTQGLTPCVRGLTPLWPCLNNWRKTPKSWKLGMHFEYNNLVQAYSWLVNAFFTIPTFILNCSGVVTDVFLHHSGILLTHFVFLQLLVCLNLWLLLSISSFHLVGSSR